MRIALIADTFPPLRSSGAVQLRDLSREFSRQGHSLCVLLPSPDQREPWTLELLDGAQVLRLKAPRTKDIGHVRRTLAELAMPFAMLRNFRKSPLSEERWDGVVWYSPSIFHGPLVSALKTSSGSKGYLIIRDIFPEWAVDTTVGQHGFGLHLQINVVVKTQGLHQAYQGVKDGIRGIHALLGTWMRRHHHRQTLVFGDGIESRGQSLPGSPSCACWPVRVLPHASAERSASSDANQRQHPIPAPSGNAPASFRRVEDTENANHALPQRQRFEND